MKSIGDANNLDYYFEPYLDKSKFELIPISKVNIPNNSVVKTLINQAPIDDYKELINQFDKVIFLSRHDVVLAAESLIGSFDLGRKYNFDENERAWEKPYFYTNTDTKLLNRYVGMQLYNKHKLEMFANELGYDVNYYEDLYLNNQPLTDSSIKLKKKYFDSSYKLRK